MKSPVKVLVIDSAHPKLLEKLKDYEVCYEPHISLVKLKNVISEYEGVIIRSKLTLSKTWIDRATKLKFIGRLGSGMDNVDVQYAEVKGITCFNAPEGNRNAVAEQTVGMLLSLLTNIHKSANEVKECKWDRAGNSGSELCDLTVGVIGYGNVGRRLSELLAGFGCNVIAYDKYKKNFGSSIVEEVSLEELKNEADVITFHTPLTEETQYYFDLEFINSVKKPFHLLNLSRGGVVNLDVVISGIKHGKILGCALDVIENEKLETHSEKQKKQFEFLAQHPKILVTPHIGGLTENSFKKLAEILGGKLQEWLSLQPFVN